MISKEEQEAGASLIESVVFRAQGRDRSDAVAKAVKAQNFVREGGLTLSLKSLVERRDLHLRRILGPKCTRKIAFCNLLIDFPIRKQNELAQLSFYKTTI